MSATTGSLFCVAGVRKRASSAPHVPTGCAQAVHALRMQPAHSPGLLHPTWLMFSSRNLAALRSAGGASEMYCGACTGWGSECLVMRKHASIRTCINNVLFLPFLFFFQTLPARRRLTLLRIQHTSHLAQQFSHCRRVADANLLQCRVHHCMGLGDAGTADGPVDCWPTTPSQG